MAFDRLKQSPSDPLHFTISYSSSSPSSSLSHRRNPSDESTKSQGTVMPPCDSPTLKSVSPPLRSVCPSVEKDLTERAYFSMDNPGTPVVEGKMPTPSYTDSPEENGTKPFYRKNRPANLNLDLNEQQTNESSHGKLELPAGTGDNSYYDPKENGLRTPNSATVPSFKFSPMLTSKTQVFDPSVSRHSRYRSPSLPVNSYINTIKVPSNVLPISAAELYNLLASSEEEANEASSRNIPKLSVPANLLSEDVTLSPYAAGPRNDITLSPASEGSCSLHNAQGRVLLVDVRPFAQYVCGKIPTAINICIPSTLLKRPGFVVAKFGQCMIPEQKAELERLDTYDYIVLYDSSSKDLKSYSSTSLIYTLLKFSKSSSITGKLCYLKGGFEEYSKQYLQPKDTDEGIDLQGSTDGESTKSHSTSLSISSSSDASSYGSNHSASSLMMPKVLTGFSLPSNNNPKALASKLQEDYDYSEDEAPISIPGWLSKDVIDAKFPKWLSTLLLSSSGPKDVCRKFQSIEQAERMRLMTAFSRDDNVQTDETGIRYSISAGVELGSKNRYYNIWPYDHTRVILQCRDAGKEGSDYINASYLYSKKSGHRYIATQGPLPETAGDFWKVIFDQEVPVIVMLTAEAEGGRVKCHSYWQERSVCGITITQTDEKIIQLSEGSKAVVTIRDFVLQCSQGKTHKVSQIHFREWPDLGAPASASDLLGLSVLKNRYITGTTNVSGNTKEPLVVVHCSAGCGRTGTFCTVDTVLDILQRGEGWDGTDAVYDVVQEFRSQRLSMVQSLSQYVLCYEAVVQWIANQF